MTVFLSAPAAAADERKCPSYPGGIVSPRWFDIPQATPGALRRRHPRGGCAGIRADSVASRSFLRAIAHDYLRSSLAGSPRPPGPLAAFSRLRSLTVCRATRRSPHRPQRRRSERRCGRLVVQQSPVGKRSRNGHRTGGALGRNLWSINRSGAGGDVGGHPRHLRRRDRLRNSHQQPICLADDSSGGGLARVDPDAGSWGATVARTRDNARPGAGSPRWSAHDRTRKPSTGYCRGPEAGDRRVGGTIADFAIKTFAVATPTQV